MTEGEIQRAGDSKQTSYLLFDCSWLRLNPWACSRRREKPCYLIIERFKAHSISSNTEFEMCFEGTLTTGLRDLIKKWTHLEHVVWQNSWGADKVSVNWTMLVFQLTEGLFRGPACLQKPCRTLWLLLEFDSWPILVTSAVLQEAQTNLLRNGFCNKIILVSGSHNLAFDTSFSLISPNGKCP